MIESPLHLATLIAAITAAGFWLERHSKLAAKIGASLLIILMGALVSNLNLVPLQSPVYDAVFGPVTSLAIVWLLFAVHFKDLKAAGPTMVISFGFACLGTALGAVVAFWLFGDAFGEHAWKLAGVMTGTYSGGSLNFVAVGRELDMPETLFTAATAADNVLTALWFGATLLLPAWLIRRFPNRSETPEKPETTPEAMAHPVFAECSLRVTDLCILLALGLGIIAAANGIGSLIPKVPSVIWLTSMALLVAQIPWVKRLSGAMQLGSIALHFFFALIGIGSKFAEIAKVGPSIFFLTLTVVAVHGLVVFGIAAVWRRQWDTAAVASQAAVGGPSTAMALAVSRGKTHLALPGVAVGLLGYGVGTYAGFAIAYLLR